MSEDPQIERLSNHFSELLSHEIGDDNLATVVERNSAEENKNVCHSHDFTDANMIMHQAFVDVYERMPTPEDEADINEAWNEAKYYHFNL